MLSKRKALILSLIYCGLGQIYKGDKTKGIIFIALYSLIIVLFVFFSSFSLLIRLFVLSILILMWLMGMIDAYTGSMLYFAGKVPEINCQWLPFNWSNPAEARDVLLIKG